MVFYLFLFLLGFVVSEIVLVQKYVQVIVSQPQAYQIFLDVDHYYKKKNLNIDEKEFVEDFVDDEKDEIEEDVDLTCNQKEKEKESFI